MMSAVRELITKLMRVYFTQKDYGSFKHSRAMFSSGAHFPVRLGDCTGPMERFEKRRFMTASHLFHILPKVLRWSPRSTARRSSQIANNAAFFSI